MPYREHHPQDFFPRRLTQNEINDPCMTIDDFFSWYHLPECKKEITALIKAAYNPGCWKKGEPGDLLYFQEQLEKLIEAAYLTHFTRKGAETGMEFVVGEDISKYYIDTAIYCANRHASTAWDYFPRCLSKKEFINPYRVFDKFFRYQDLPGWRDDLQDLLSYALSKFSIQEVERGIDSLTTHTYLQKLVEAAYLIRVREEREAPSDGSEIVDR